MSLPVIYSACLSHPGHRFTLVTRPSLVSLFINSPENLAVEGVEFELYKGITGKWTLWKRLYRDCKPEFYVALDWGNDLRPLTRFARLNRCRSAAVREPSGKKLLIRKNNKVMLPLSSVRARYRETFFRVGLPVQNRFDGLYGKNGKGDPTLFDSVTKPPLPGEKWIGIAPFAKHPGKSYPVELMEKVVDILEKELSDVKIFLFGGGEKEREILKGWSQRHPATISPAVARLGFPAELSLLSYMDVMLTMDAANMHLASLVGVNVVTVWGATHPYGGFKGWRQKENADISLPMPCRPCSLFGDLPCHRGDYMCLTAIKPAVIAEKVIQELRN